MSTAVPFIARERQRFAHSPVDPHEALLTVRLFLLNLVDHLCEARLADGQRLCDVTDSAAYARELAAVIEIEEMLPRQKAENVCHACGHPHKDKECGMEMGGSGRVCKCDVEVSA